jgi:hypothetical protein
MKKMKYLIKAIIRILANPLEYRKTKRWYADKLRYPNF